jgi:RimJ/RimL family protein N-acetyltransferase
MTTTAGIYLLAPAHADAIQRIASSADVAAVAGFPYPYPPGEGAAYVARQIEAREQGRAFAFAVMDRGEVVGVCSLDGIYDDRAASLNFWIGRAHSGQGYASFAVKMILEFAFQNLKLPRIDASERASCPIARGVLSRQGFDVGRDADGTPAFLLTRERWMQLRNAPALAAFHPALKGILEQELAAGNEVMETGKGWPEPDSVFVRLRDPFRTRPASLPEGVRYTEPNDPHWWKADYSSESPRHILAC